MTIQELWQEGNQILAAAGVQEAALDSRYLLEWALKQKHTFLLLNPSYEADAEAEQTYRHAIHMRKNHRPLQYIIGEQEFMGFPFQVNEHVLIPRQDTEILVETVLNNLQKLQKGEMQEYRLLDLCCGSGCIGLSIWKLLQQKWKSGQVQNKTGECTKTGAIGRWRVDLADVSGEALAVAEKNAKRLHADVELIESDLFHEVDGTYHVIVSNPPYIPSKVVDTLMPEVRDQEPRLALDGKEDGLFFYRRIMEQAMEYLEDEGYVFFEIGFDQAEDVRQILVDAGLEQIVVKQDLAGLDRVIYGKKNKAGCLLGQED